MYEMIRTSQRVELPEDDVITLEQAAQLSDRAITVIGAMLDRGRLPWYQWRPAGDAMRGERVQRFTSRKAILALPPKG